MAPIEDYIAVNTHAPRQLNLERANDKLSCILLSRCVALPGELT